MDLSDKIKICANCKKSKRDIQRGIICGLTNEKPAFENTCPSLDIDEKESAKTKKIIKEARKNEISGSLSFFLWVIIGLFSTIEITSSILTVYSLGFRLYFIIGNLISFITAVYCIASFYKQKNNSVAIAYAYTAMIAISTIYLTYINIIIRTNIITTIFGFILGMTWCTSMFIYITVSSKIKYIFPKEIRCHKKTELVLVGSYSLCMIFYFVLLFALSSFKGDIINSKLINFCANNKGKILLVAENTNNEAPIQIINNLYLNDIYISNKYVNYTYIHTDKSKCNFTNASLACFAKIMKNNWLKDTFTSPVDDITKCIAKTNYGIRCEYYDKDTNLIYINKIQHDEIIKLLQSDTAYRCRKDDIDFVLKYTNMSLPITFSIPINNSKDDLIVKIARMRTDYVSNILYVDITVEAKRSLDSNPQGRLSSGIFLNGQNNGQASMPNDLKLSTNNMNFLVDLTTSCFPENNSVALAMIDDANIILRFYDKNGNMLFSHEYQYEHVNSMVSI